MKTNTDPIIAVHFFVATSIIFGTCSKYDTFEVSFNNFIFCLISRWKQFVIQRKREFQSVSLLRWLSHNMIFERQCDFNKFFEAILAQFST